jgi:probable rRNA maturation factor
VAAGSPPSALLRRFARAAAAARSTITLRVVGGEESRKLNRKFRARDQPTNVLSFPYGNGAGDVVLCHPVIAREARQQGKTLRAHYAHLVVHGVLHLRGHDHLRAGEARRMERAEARAMRRLRLPNPWKAHAGAAPS